MLRPMNPSVLKRTVVIFFLLSALLHPDPALADGCVAPSFGAARTFGAGIGPNSVTVGDFNGDGKPDLAVVNRDFNTDLGKGSVLLGNGDGTFQTAVSYGAGSDPGSVTVADFNGDGKPDGAVANQGSDVASSGTYTKSGVWVLLGKGDGAFQTAVNYGAGTRPISVTVGDFNGDGKPD